MSQKNKIIYTIGHSTRPIDQFIAILKIYGIEEILDVRTIPKSRYNPQFNKKSLSEALKKNNIKYHQVELLGGLRHAKKDSENMGWRNASFRGYADYMQTPDFSKGLDELEKIAAKQTVAIMCAEVVPWRCHRSLIADALTRQKIKVIHVLDIKHSYVHKITPFLKFKAGKIYYPKVDNDK